MAMMPSIQDRNNHYDPYDNDADLIDPDDGKYITAPLCSYILSHD